MAALVASRWAGCANRSSVLCSLVSVSDTPVCRSITGSPAQERAAKCVAGALGPLARLGYAVRSCGNHDRREVAPGSPWFSCRCTSLGLLNMWLPLFPQWPRYIPALIIILRADHSPVIENSDRRSRGYWRHRPCHYPASLASDTGGLPAAHARRQGNLARAVTTAVRHVRLSRRGS